MGAYKKFLAKIRFKVENNFKEKRKFARIDESRAIIKKNEIS